MINRTIYEEIGTRAGGDIYIGVVGPVRSGKSTFITRFMEQMVLPLQSDPYKRARAVLLRNLQGSSAFRNGGKPCQTETEERP